MMRKTIAKRLVAAKNEAPHFYLTATADMARVVEWRSKMNEEKAVKDGTLPKASINDIVVLAVAKALKQHPQVNSSWQEDHIQQFANVDISIAVALPEGLITPIVFGADGLGVREIAGKTKELAKKARDNQLEPADYVGGTFTISNLGMMNIDSFTAIINPPQACILAVGGINKTPAFANDGSIYAKHEMKMTMSCDHRVVDGMVGAEFLKPW